MKTIRRYVVSTLVCAALAVPAAAQQAAPLPQPPPLLPVPPPSPLQVNPERVIVPFSDPSRQGSLKIKMLQGSILVKGTNRKDVLIQGGSGTDLSRARPVAPPPGMRRLTQPAGFSVEESNNEISLSVSRFNRRFDIQIEVPVRTNLDLSLMNGSAISVEDVDGELEISNLNGAIMLKNVGGSVVAHSMNGSVTAVVTRVTPQAPMSFTSMNGTIDVTLPPGIKANLKMRSDQGDIFTDFDFQMTQSAQAEVKKGDRLRIDVNRSVAGTVNGGGPDIELRSFNGTVILRKGK